jgi:tetratricopeptide (TPR) repeat protein
MKFKRLRKLVLVAVLTLTAALTFPLSGCSFPNKGSDSGAYQKGLDALESGDYDSAMTQFRTAVDQDSRVAESYRGEGIVYMKQGDYDSAATVFERSLTALRKSQNQDAEFEEDVEYYLAEAYLRNNQIDQALELYAELEDGKNPAQAYLLHGIANIKNNDIDSAKEDFDQVVKKNLSYENCIRIYEALAGASHKADGAAYLEQALNEEPKTADDYYYQGMVYYDLGNTDKALESFKTAVDEGSADASSMYAKVCIDAGKTDDARSVFNAMVKDGTNLAAAYNGLALCSIADGDYDDALSQIQNGLDQNDDSANEALLYNEVVVYEKKLDFETAKSKMESFLQTYPDNEEAQREYKFLQTR